MLKVTREEIICLWLYNKGGKMNDLLDFLLMIGGFIFFMAIWVVIV